MNVMLQTYNYHRHHRRYCGGGGGGCCCLSTIRYFTIRKLHNRLYIKKGKGKTHRRTVHEGQKGE